VQRIFKLKHRISAETPCGDEDTDSKWAKQLLAELADGLEADVVDGYLAGEDRPSTVVEPKPRATGLTLEEIVADHLDYLHHEALFVVSTTFEVTAFRTLRFGLQYDSETIEHPPRIGSVDPVELPQLSRRERRLCRDVRYRTWIRRCLAVYRDPRGADESVWVEYTVVAVDVMSGEITQQ
jgi:hypothetical protein